MERATWQGLDLGVAQRMKEICPNAHFINCLAQCLNLAVSHASKTVPLMQNALDIVHHLAEDLDLEHGNNARISLCISLRPLCPTSWTISPCISLRQLCPTRWTVRVSVINSVVCNYEHLMQTLNIIQNNRATPADAASTARSLLKQLQMSETYFRCAVAYRLFAITDALQLQFNVP